MHLSEENILELKKKAKEIRISIIEMLRDARSGHTAGSLGMTDIFTLLYFHILKHNPKDPFWSERDRLVLSNGHICPVLYATMAHVGYFPIEELKTLRKFGSRLQGHPHREYLPILETSSGPLGSGLSQAVGMALADKIDSKNKSHYIYCLVSDGELDEGNSWEGAMLAGKNKLNNLIVVLDRNKIQISGSTEEVMPLEPLVEKWKAFNWNVLEVDGHDFRKLNEVFEEAQIYSNSSDKTKHKPTLIVAHTVPGKGIKDWENNYKWHGIAPTKEQAINALRELI